MSCQTVWELPEPEEQIYDDGNFEDIPLDEELGAVGGFPMRPLPPLPDAERGAVGGVPMMPLPNFLTTEL